MSALVQTIPFIEARYRGKKQRPRTVSLRLSDTTAESGAALGIANYWHRSSSPLEYAHYVVDSELTFHCVRDEERIGERGVVCINVCAQPTFDVQFWSDQDYAEVLRNAAELVAKLCWEYGIPVRDIDLLGHRRWFGRGGIMVNIKGAWPKDDFLASVKERLETYKQEGGL